ncbi:MAG TPA: PEP-CTERM sorting domain-containing protein [Cyanobacteria bacterium UBA11372]|nr:PEP-CTERM sorting domain-containing protein [Cyanobacteria bacterium UBA11372]
MPFTWKSLTLAMGTATLVLGTLSSAQAYTLYTNRAAWQAAVDAISASVTTDTFSTNIPKAQTITLGSGIVSTNSFPPDISAIPFDNNAVTGGQYRNATGGDTASATITWTFPGAVRAFGADFFSVNASGLTLTGNFDGTGDQTFGLNAQIGGNTGFFGVIGNIDFGSIVFGNAGSSVDGFDIDNASFAVTPSQPPSSVPEPSTVMALAVMAGGLFLSRQGKPC